MVQETGELKGLMENRMPQSRARSTLKEGVTHPTHDCRCFRFDFLVLNHVEYVLIV